MKFFLTHVPSVTLISLVLLASAQKSSNNLRDVDVQELARQNKITTQILEAFIQKKLGLASNNYRAPSIFDIIPMKKPEERTVRQSMNEEEPEQQETSTVEDTDVNEESDADDSKFEDLKEYSEYDGLQSVESEQIDSILYSEDCSSCGDDELGVTRWTMPLLKSGEKRYYLGIFFKANWFKAQQYCRFHGMHLASISSQEENDRLEKYVRESGFGREHFWTSGTDLAEEGSFFWMANGRPLTFVNWNAGEPNNFRYENGEEENCLELWNRDDKGLKWNDSPCSFETYFICEVRTD
ncbi:low affinity immunoglobulin epsilon Fc receptor-like isoform X2 [Leptidea sinapis]|uniref:low affinity immunoglobulin epsilon Fc receptor-like isoform X2 n=1 Tax=Leptidea sinapis TaxID=189913 RepID=UPI002123ED4B|nr:low affinity immunoglobulin epsilon Fc receptor-like isoform X2 [Leptidea sinapis]